MTKQLEPAIARICKANGEVVGAGFLVSKNYVLTCAHVVNEALYGEQYIPEEPTSEVYLDFPLVEPGKRLTARVVRWIAPVQPNAFTLLDEVADIAVLELERNGTDKARPVRLVTAENLSEHPFVVFGFPYNLEKGVESGGILRSPEAGGRVYMEVLHGYPVEGGFSGAPIWNIKLEGVAGMTVTQLQHEDKDVKAAFMIPTSQLVKAFPELNQQVIQPDIWRRSYTQAKDTVEPGTRTQNLHEIPKNKHNYSFIVDSVNWRELRDGSLVYSFDVFNGTYADGVIESRSQDGELIDIRGIDGIKIPSSVLGFGFMSIERLWRLATEGYEFLDPRNSLRNIQKTEVRNIRVLPGGTLKLTKRGEYALVYNQANFLSSLFFESPNPSGLLALCEKLHKQNVSSFVKSESLRSWMNANLTLSLDKGWQAFVSESWFDKHTLEEKRKICEEVMREQNIKSSGVLENTLETILRIVGSEMLKVMLVKPTEDFVKRSYGFLQWLDWERAQIVEEQQKALFINN